MIYPRFLAGLALAWFALGASAPAHGAKVAPLAPRLPVSAAPELRDRFQDAIARGLQLGAVTGVEVMAGSDVRVRLQANNELLGCQGGTCLTRAVTELKVDRLALAEIDVSSKNYSIQLRLIDQGGAEIWRTAENCDICTVREADEAVARAAARMGPWIARPGPTDQANAAAQAKAAAAAPPVAPSNIPSAEQTPEAHHLYYRYGWISAAVVGGLFVVAAVPFLVYAGKDGQTNCDPSVNPRNCPTIYKGNLGAGLGLLSAGVVAGGGTFAILYYLDRRQQRQSPPPRVSLVPTAGGAMLGLEGRF